MVVGGAVALAFFLRARSTRGTYRVADARSAMGSLEADRKVLAALRDAGADLTKVTEVNFYLYFSSRAAAAAAALDASTPPLTATVREGADDVTWLCYVTGQMIPNEDEIHAASERLADLARRHGGEYDGWEAAVTT
jgi:hypothetical protein